MDIIEVTRRLSEINFSTNTADDVRIIFNSISKQGFGINLKILHKGNIVYRARLIEESEIIQYENELSYIPAENNTTYKRASTPSNTMFYGILLPDMHWKAIGGCLGEMCDCLRSCNPKQKNIKLLLANGKYLKTLCCHFFQILMVKINPLKITQK